MKEKEFSQKERAAIRKVVAFAMAFVIFAGRAVRRNNDTTEAVELGRKFADQASPLIPEPGDFQ